MKVARIDRVCSALLGAAALSLSAAWADSTNPLVEDLRSWVEISSGTRQTGAVNQVQMRLGERLKALGFSVELTAHPTKPDASGKLLVATRKGASAQFVTLIVHADTVFEPDSGFLKMETSPDGLWAKGPGVIDDKGGIVVAVSGLERYLKAHPQTPLSMRVVSSPSEETGSEGFLDRFHMLSQESWITMGFEPAYEGGDIVGSRRGNRWYEIEVQGREAHAGRAFREGVNACTDLAIRLVAISKLTDLKRDLTVSVGHIEGGKDKFNIVCGSAKAKVDTRFSDPRNSEALNKKIIAVLESPGLKAVSDQALAKVIYKIADESPAFSESSESRPFLKEYARQISEIEGRKVQVARSGGTADTNLFSRPGAIVVDGLGPVGEKMHTPDERIQLKSLESRTEALAKFLDFLEAHSPR